MDLNKLTITKACELLNAGEITSVELVRACFNEIKKNDYNALISSYEKEALIKAKEIDEKRTKGETLGILAGVPVIIKDNINLKGTKTTCASQLLSNYESIYNATVVEKLIEQDAIIIAKANMDEFAMGSSNENSSFGVVLNPVNTAYVPGGSSGGSAASVAGHLAMAALGTDTGGSVRQPASFCGVVGLKPTYGLVSRYGVTAFGSSFDQVGPLTKTVKDSATMLTVLAGHDNKEQTSAPEKNKNYVAALNKDIKGLKIGIAKEFYEFEMNEDVKQKIDEAIEFYKQNGAEIVNVTLPSIPVSLPVYYVLSSAEAASNLGRFDGIRYGVREEGKDLIDVYYNSRTKGFGAEVKRRIMLGNFVLSSGYFDAYYNKASKVRQMLKYEFREAFEQCDVLLTPTSPTGAFKIGEKSDDHIEMYLSDIYTVPINTVGVPAISIPCGKNKDGMPIGMQLIGNHFEEEKLFTLADFYETNKEVK